MYSDESNLWEGSWNIKDPTLIDSDGGTTGISKGQSKINKFKLETHKISKDRSCLRETTGHANNKQKKEN